MQSRGPRTRALEQPPALGACGLDQRLGLALCRGDHSGRVTLSREYPVDRPCNARIG